MFQSHCHLGNYKVFFPTIQRHVLIILSSRQYKIFFPTIQRHVLIILSSRTLRGFLPYNSEACSNHTVISDTTRFSSLQFRGMFQSYCHLGNYKVFFPTIQRHVLIILSSRQYKIFFPTIQRHVLIILSSLTLQDFLPYNSESCSNHTVIADTTRLSSLQFRGMF